MAEVQPHGLVVRARPCVGEATFAWPQLKGLGRRELDFLPGSSWRGHQGTLQRLLC